MAHKGSYKTAKAYSEGDGPSVYTSLSAYNKMTSYSEVVKQLRGPDFDPSQNPIDPEALMISAGGKSHGTLAMCDGFVPITETLSQIKSRQTSSAPAIRQRARPVDLAIEVSFLHYFFRSFVPGWMMKIPFEEWLQAALMKEREATRLLLEERDRNTQRLLDEERARNNAHAKAMHDFVAVSQLCEKQGYV